MPQKTIKMLIPLEGISKGKRKTTITTEGFVGAECEMATAPLEKMLGFAAAEREHTEEYFKTEERREYHREGGGGGNIDV